MFGEHFVGWKITDRYKITLILIGLLLISSDFLLNIVTIAGNKLAQRNQTERRVFLIMVYFYVCVFLQLASVWKYKRKLREQKPCPNLTALHREHFSNRYNLY